jgi:chromosome segregation ATPase
MGLKYEDVAKAANELLAKGASTGWRAIRAQLGGSGSSTTISKHLKAWRALQPAAAVQARQLPEELVAALASELEKAGAAARLDAEQQLWDAQDELESLRTEGEQFEEKVQELTTQLFELTSERDVLDGRVLSKIDENDELKAQLANEQAKVEAARLEIATALVRHEQSQKNEQAQALEIERLRTLAETANAERIAAQQAAAVAHAKLEAMQERAVKAEALAEKSGADARAVAAELAHSKAAEAATSVQNATLMERLAGAEKHAQRLEKTLADAVAKVAGDAAGQALKKGDKSDKGGLTQGSLGV